MTETIVVPGVVAKRQVRAEQGASFVLPPPPAPVLEREVRGVALPDPPDVDVDASVLEPEGDRRRFETPPTNGEYSGRAPVRYLPRGISGDQLTVDKSSRLLAGERWQRGTQLVEILEAGAKVRFREITDHDGEPPADPEKVHTLGRVRFLDTGRPA